MAAPRRRPPRMLQVIETRDTSPHTRIITLGGAELEGFPEDCPGAHLKLFLPRHGQSDPVLPTVGPKGITWPAPHRRPIVRTYSVRRFDPLRCHLDIEFVLHPRSGPASDWARKARAGDRAGIAGPGGPHPMLPLAQHYLMVGDLSSLPAITALLENMESDTRARVLCEVPDDRGIRELECPPGVDVRWYVRRGPSPLPQIVEALPWPGAGTYAWIAGEHGAVVAIRDYLRETHGLGRDSMYAVPYWKAGLHEDAYHQERHRVMDELEAA
ncbi:MAG: siderophore-interacting protein [Proteobacteria bacterium]|nr:siderophore-interacting protein [Pseudomonadota bacterium]